MERATKLRLFQERLIKSTANNNDSLTPAQKATYLIWKNTILEGLAENTTKARKKEHLKTLKQEETKRVKDCNEIRIDDVYKIAYCVGPAMSQDAEEVAALFRSEAKIIILLNGLKTPIADLV